MLSSEANKGLILQAGDPLHWRRHQLLTNTVQRLATGLGFHCHPQVLSSTDVVRGPFARLQTPARARERLELLASKRPEACLYTQKVTAIRDAHRSLRHGQLLVYVDLDAEFAGCRSSDLLQSLPATAADGSDCIIIAQDTEYIVHTGVLAIAGGHKAASLLSAWDFQQRRLGVCEASADQISFAYAVLDWLLPGYSSRPEFERCDGLMEGYRNGIYGYLAHFNSCFRNTLLREARLVAQVNRSAHGLCFLPRYRRPRLAMHDYSDHYEAGDLFFHHRKGDTGNLGPAGRKRVVQ